MADAIDVKALRTRLGMSQAQFAASFHLPLGTVRDWEQGRRAPAGSARLLLKVIHLDHAAVLRALNATD